ncbi:MAG: N-acetylmuramoyl-L-alanine amidase [Pseudomonadota bacterium]
MNIALLLTLLVSVLGPAMSANAESSTLLGIRIHEAPRYTRVVLDLSAPTSGTLSTLAGPDRVFLDLTALNLSPGLNTVVPADLRRLRAIRTGPQEGGARLVLDTNAPMYPNTFALGPNAQSGHRLVIDLYDDPRQRPANANRGPVRFVAPSRSAAPQRIASVPQPPARARPKPPPLRDVLVAVDPGHGGKDPGAVAPGGKIREKDVTLAISRRLVATLKAQKGFDALLVRSGDELIGLRRRVSIARARRADLFVSIHADAFHSSKVRGASVYVLSQRGATSEMARWLEKKEKESELIGGAGDVSLAGKDKVLAEVLLDMSTQATRSGSYKAGVEVLRELGGIAELHKNQLGKAAFMVLKAPDVPSILVETGFISNPGEARRLASARYQQQLSDAIARGVTRYLSEAAAPGTYLAAQQPPPDKRHTIQRGETLSGLAVRYGVAARRIREANGLRGDAIRVGQRLIIPAS